MTRSRAPRLSPVTELERRDNPGLLTGLVLIPGGNRGDPEITARVFLDDNQDGVSDDGNSINVNRFNNEYTLSAPEGTHRVGIAGGPGFVVSRPPDPVFVPAAGRVFGGDFVFSRSQEDPPTAGGNVAGFVSLDADSANSVGLYADLNGDGLFSSDTEPSTYVTAGRTPRQYRLFFPQDYSAGPFAVRVIPGNGVTETAPSPPVTAPITGGRSVPADAGDLTTRLVGGFVVGIVRTTAVPPDDNGIPEDTDFRARVYLDVNGNGQFDGFENEPGSFDQVLGGRTEQVTISTNLEGTFPVRVELFNADGYGVVEPLPPPVTLFAQQRVDFGRVEVRQTRGGRLTGRVFFPAAEWGDLDGRVLLVRQDQGTEQVVDSAPVTRQNNQIDFRTLTDGLYTVRLDQLTDGFEPDYSIVDSYRLEGGRQEGVSVSVRPTGGFVTFQVYTLAPAFPPGQAFTAYADLDRDGTFDPADGEPSLQATERGKTYRFQFNRPGTYAIGLVVPDGYEVTNTPFSAGTVSGGSTYDVGWYTLRRTANATLTGRVDIPAADPDIKVAVYADIDGNGDHSAGELFVLVDRANPVYSLPVPDGTLTVRAVVNSGPVGAAVVGPPPTPVTVAAGGTAAGGDFAVGVFGGTISGEVRFADNVGTRTVDVVLVLLDGANSRWVASRTVSRSSPRYSIDTRFDGRYTVELIDGNRQVEMDGPSPEPVSVAGGSSAEIGPLAARLIGGFLTFRVRLEGPPPAAGFAPLVFIDENGDGVYQDPIVIGSGGGFFIPGEPVLTVTDLATTYQFVVNDRNAYTLGIELPSGYEWVNGPIVVSTGGGATVFREFLVRPVGYTSPPPVSPEPPPVSPPPIPEPPPTSPPPVSPPPVTSPPPVSPPPVSPPPGTVPPPVQPRLSVPNRIAGGAAVRVPVTRDDGTTALTLDPFEPTFVGGATATMATDAAGQPIIVVAAGDGGAPRVVVYAADGTLLASFFAFESSFRNGASVTAGADGTIVVGAGVGGAPRVRTFRPDGTPVGDGFMFDATLRGGVSLAAADFTGDGVIDLAVGAGPGGGPVVRAFDGRTGGELPTVLAGPADDRDGATVRAADLDADGTAELVVRAAGAVSVFDVRTGAEVTDGFPSDAVNAVFVG